MSILIFQLVQMEMGVVTLGSEIRLPRQMERNIRLDISLGQMYWHPVNEEV